MVKKRTIMRALKLNEISIVDRPAQEGANVMIMKRKDGQSTPQTTGDVVLTKGAILSGVQENHQHTVNMIGGFDGAKLTHGRTSWDRDHDHPWVLDPSGQVIIGLFDGHGHDGFVPEGLMSLKGGHEDDEDDDDTSIDGRFPIKNKEDLENAVQAFGRADEDDRELVASHIERRAKALDATDLLPEEGVLADLLSKRELSEHSTADKVGINRINKEDDMPDAKKTVEQVSAELESMTKRLERSEKVAAIDIDQLPYFKGLDTEAQDKFLAKAKDERKQETDKDEEKRKAEKAKEASDDKTVVYKSINGTEYFNTDDARLVAQVKENDDLRKDFKASQDALKDQAYAKRAADELGHLPGDESAHIALLKSVDKIEDKDQREAALAALKANNEQHAKAYDVVGYQGNGGFPTVEKGSAEDQLDVLAKKQAEADGSDYYAAYDKVLKTPEGGQLYAKSVQH